MNASGSRLLNARTRNYAAPMKFSSWPALFLPRRNSTANSSPEGLYRTAPRQLWGRGDLQGLADCPIVLPASCSASTQPGTVLRKDTTRCDPGAANPECLASQYAGLRRRQGLAPDEPRKLCSDPLHLRAVESAQYVSIRYGERLAEAGIEPSVGSKGDSYDNASADTNDDLYKAELIHRRAPWKTKESLHLATLEWVA